MISQGGQNLNNFNKINLFKIVTLLCCLNFVGCSTFDYFRDDSVPKEKYEKLLQKYNSLINKSVPTSDSGNISLAVDDAKAVDEFRNRLLLNRKTQPHNLALKPYHKSRVQKDISLLYQAHNMFRQKKFGDVIILLKELENSQVAKIRAQARYLLGVTMYEQGELDMSMQIFEEIVVSMRDTVFALMSLEQLINNTLETFKPYIFAHYLLSSETYSR